MKYSRLFIYGAFLFLLAGIFAGCRSMEDYEKERSVRAVQHFEQSKWNRFKPGHVFTLDECLDMALKFNLDMRVAKMEEDVASEQKIAEALGMLPELTASDSYSYRNNEAASRSEQLDTSSTNQNGTYSYSTSQDQGQNNLNIDLALSVLDFGLAAFNTCQAQDRELIRAQRTRRIAQNLQADVVRAYFQVAAAQQAIEIAHDLLEKCQSRYQLIQVMAEKRLISPFRAFDELRRFLDMEKRLNNYIRAYDTSRAELKALLGISVGDDIYVDTSLLNVEQPEVFELPEIQTMEQIAILERPELYEIDMQRHLNVLELYKTVVMMFPNVRIFVDFTNSSSSFVYHHSWMELGVRAAYNLLKLPQHIARAKSIHTQIKTEEVRGFAQAIGIMAQVRIADVNLRNAYERFLMDNRNYTLYSNNLKNAEVSLKRAGGVSQLELDHIRLSTAEVQIERLFSLSTYYVTYYRLLNVVGIDKMTLKPGSPYVDGCKKRLADAKVEAEEEIRNAWKEAKKGKWEDIPIEAPGYSENNPGVKTVRQVLSPLDDHENEIFLPLLAE